MFGVFCFGLYSEITTKMSNNGHYNRRDCAKMHGITTLYCSIGQYWAVLGGRRSINQQLSDESIPNDVIVKCGNGESRVLVGESVTAA